MTPPPGDILPTSFADRDPVAVARALLGQQLAAWSGRRWRAGRIVETEAYLGPQDRASHSARGRTRRTEVMFGPPGHCYVFLVYGMHLCANVVTGSGAAVLLRALEVPPGEGRADGPGRLTRWLGVGPEHNAHPLDRPPLVLLAGPAVSPGDIVASRRIGVDFAGPYWARRRLRFSVRGHPGVSAPRP
jgi:DNA-3-methyladenine glycosylase